MYVYCVNFFFFNDTATTEIYTLSLHDALPILATGVRTVHVPYQRDSVRAVPDLLGGQVDAIFFPVPIVRPQIEAGTMLGQIGRHTSELQSRQYLVCRLLLEKKKKYIQTHTNTI